MSCNCSSPNSYEPVTSYRKAKDLLSGKWIIDVQQRRLYVDGAIYDVYGDIVGYITKNESGDVVRIFSKNVVKIIE
jgi:hypothetical protein